MIDQSIDLSFNTRGFLLSTENAFCYEFRIGTADCRASGNDASWVQSTKECFSLSGNESGISHAF